jgi:hypothetical protein
VRGSQPSCWVSTMICRESSTAAYLPGWGTNFGAFGVNDMTRSLREGKRFSSASLRRHHRPRSALSSVGGKHPPLWGSARATYLRGISRFFTRRRDKSERVLERKAANPKLRMAGSGALPPEAPDPAPNQYTGSASGQAEEDRQGPLSGPRRTRQFEDQDRLRPSCIQKPSQANGPPAPDHWSRVKLSSAGLDGTSARFVTDGFMHADHSCGPGGGTAFSPPIPGAATTKNPVQIPLLNRCDKRFHVR